MKIIFSRKGFDSASGGVPNPILPDGSFLPLPIPDPSAPMTYADLQGKGFKPASVVSGLTRGRIAPGDGAHLDPDLDAGSLPRQRGWRPLFGQAGAAQGHLKNHRVGPGDLFLFFGWFRQTDWVKSRLRYRPNAPDLHVLFGWLQVESCFGLGESTLSAPRWTRYHPHFFGARGARNTLYLASRRLVLEGRLGRSPGAGLFPKFQRDLVLTEKGMPRGQWLLPQWFHPRGRGSCLSYHQNPSRWQHGASGTHLRSANRGQEFVLNGAHYPEAVFWAGNLIARRGRDQGASETSSARIDSLG